MKIGIYYRVSTDLQTFESQRHEVERWLEGWSGKSNVTSVTIFQDEGSGRKEKEHLRPGFQALKAAIETGEIDTVVVYKLDRLSRDAQSTIRLLMDWIEAGINFYSVSQPIFQLGSEHPFRLTMLTIFAELAQLERETIVQRVKAGLEATKARGTKLGRPKIKDEKEESIRLLRLEGLSIKMIARKTRVGRMTVIRVLKRA